MEEEKTPQSKTEEIRKQVEARKEEEKKKFGGNGKSKKPLPSSFIQDCLKANELGDGILFAELHRGDYLYNKNAKEWMSWTGHHWERDIMEDALTAVENVVDAFLEEADRVYEKIREAAKKGKDDEPPKRLKGLQASLFKRVSRLRSQRGRNNCIHFAHTCRDPLAINGDELDCQPWFLPCSNGVIELETGKLRDGVAEDYLLKCSPTEWQGIDAPAPLWEKTLLEIFSDDQDLVGYVQRLFGCAIVGEKTEHIFPVLHGQGRNGKTLIIETISSVLGSLAGPIQADMLLDQGRFKSSAGPSPDIMALRGLRLAFASETDVGRRISPSRVKWLTGGDRLVGRNPHDKYESTFIPTHTLFLLTNNKPHAPADDFAFWERVHMVPFLLSFVDRDPQDENELPVDKTLSDRLVEEYSGILAWLVRGCLLWQKGGLDPPDIVLNATAEYRREEDILADFMDERCVLDPDMDVGATELYDSFQDWYEKNISAKKVPAQKRFGGWMAKKRFEKEKVGGIYRYFGLGLSATVE